MELANHVRALDALATASVTALLDEPRTQGLSRGTRASVAYIERHYCERVRLADLAAASGESTFQLIRAFRRDIGTTPHAFLVRVRVSVAAALLAAGEPIAAIATAVGFVDQAHFTRHFKRLHGRTPARHRAAALARRSPRNDAQPSRRASAAALMPRPVGERVPVPRCVSASAQSRGDGRFARLVASDRSCDARASAHPLARERALRASASPRALAGPLPSAAALTRADAADGRYGAAAC